MTNDLTRRVRLVAGIIGAGLIAIMAASAPALSAPVGQPGAVTTYVGQGWG